MMVDLNSAVALLKSGNVVAIPTETVYGLAADAFQMQAVKKAFQMKGRPADNPLIVHISNTSQLPQVSQLNEEEQKRVELLASEFWPGPLTLVMPRSPHLPDMVTGGLSTVAVRMPDHEIALQLIEKTGPLTAPSANRSGGPSPTRAIHILQDFGDRLAVLDGGYCKVGLESTVLDITETPFVILRKGVVGAEEIERATGIETLFRTDGDLRRSPGTRYTHYKPEAEVRWLQPDEEIPEEATLVLHTSSQVEDRDDILSYDGDFDTLARDLYDIFRTADYQKKKYILIEDLPENSGNPVIQALRDRIDRAAGSDEGNVPADQE